MSESQMRPKGNAKCGMAVCGAESALLKEVQSCGCTSVCTLVQREAGTAEDSPGATHPALASVPDQILILP